MQKRFLLVPLSLFVISNFLGILVALQFLTTEIVEKPAVANETPLSGVYFFGMLMIATGIMLLLYKLKANFLIKVWFFIALFSTQFIFFSAFFNLIFAIAISVVLSVIRIFSKNLALRNLIYIFSFSGAGAFFGALMGLIPSLILIIFLSIYDIVAVNFTKHMISLAKAGYNTDTLMGFVYPKKSFKEKSKNKKAEKKEKGKIGEDMGLIGGGDIIVPMIFSIALLKVFGLFASISSIIFSALFLSILMIKMREGKVYPAIPAVCSGALVGFLVWLGISVLLQIL